MSILSQRLAPARGEPTGRSTQAPNLAWESRPIITSKTSDCGRSKEAYLAPDVSREVIQQYLEEYRIRVITYDNRDQTHRNLVRLIESISDFTPPRIAVRASQAVADASGSPLGSGAAAPGFFVFTKLSVHTDWESKRIQVMVAALRSAVPRLVGLQHFSLQQAFELVG